MIHHHQHSNHTKTATNQEKCVHEQHGRSATNFLTETESRILAGRLEFGHHANLAQQKEPLILNFLGAEFQEYLQLAHFSREAVERLKPENRGAVTERHNLKHFVLASSYHHIDCGSAELMLE